MFNVFFWEGVLDTLVQNTVGNDVSFTEVHDSLPGVNLIPLTGRAHAVIAVVTRI